MKSKILSIRPFIGAKNFSESRRFYTDLGFQEVVLSNNLSLFQTATIAFYLQDAYVKDWIDNTMIFIEVEDLDSCWNELVSLEITSKYKEAKLVPIRNLDWGRECFLHDPSGVLWHFGSFSKM